MNIKTENVCPPIPNRAFDWIAYDDDTYDGAPDSRTRNQIGSGSTELAAIEDLLTILDIVPDDDPELQEFVRDAKALKTKMVPRWEARLTDREDGIIGTGETELEAIKHLAEAYREQDEEE